MHMFLASIHPIYSIGFHFHPARYDLRMVARLPITTGSGSLPSPFFFSSRRRHTRSYGDWSSDVCSSDLAIPFMQREIQDAAYRYQREVEEHSRIVVGVNEFVTDEPPPGNLFQVDATVGRALAERVARVRAARDRDGARRALDELETAARGRDNLVPLLVTAVEVGVTLGEVRDRLRVVFGVHQPSVAF